MTQKPRWDSSPEVEAQIETLISQLSLEAKIALVSGKNDVASRPDWASEEHPPFPALALADGPAGVRLNSPAIHGGRATAMPAPIALAAGWSQELAREYGDLLGSEFAATGHNVMLGPAVDIARAPVGGRTFEAFGEDPLLQARMVAPEIEAIQAHGVQACLKHYLVNNQEFQRNTIDVQIDERTLHDLYLRPVVSAVEAGVASVMGSYNKLNGTYACENPYLLTTVLREELGFRGWVMSDFMATPNTVESANAGLEWELGLRHWGDTLRSAVESGAVTTGRLDEMVRRILRPTIGFARTPAIGTFPVAEHSARARAIAEQCMVLLKNDSNLLPLDRSAPGSIALIGPDAASVAAYGGGSAGVQPTHSVSVLDGLRDLLGDAPITHLPGADPIHAGALLPGLPAVPGSWFTTAEGEPSGLRATYWASTDFSGEPHTSRIEPGVNINYGFFDLFAGANPATPGAPIKPAELGGSFSARWQGRLAVPADGEYTFELSCYGSARLLLDGELLLDTASGPGEDTGTTTLHRTRIALRAGSQPELVAEYVTLPLSHFFGFPEARLRLGWQPPAEVLDPAIQAAAQLASACDLAIVVARAYEGEQMDRPDIALPNQQAALIRAVAAANPRTVVVLMNGAPLEIASWEAGVPTILEAWYAGQEQGAAVARVLFGETNPGGKLPLTFPTSLSETPIATPEQYPGVDGAVHYHEGVFVGYRGYQQRGITPQYPFGFGLSYTTFAYSDLRTGAATLASNGTLDVQVDITNTGQRAGDEVVQLYAGYANSAVERPLRELKGFQRLHLQPGETRTATITLAARDLACWNTVLQQYTTEPGTIRLWVGSSSADLPLETTIELT